MDSVKAGCRRHTMEIVKTLFEVTSDPAQGELLKEEKVPRGGRGILSQ
jgi:hypothetical protein